MRKRIIKHRFALTYAFLLFACQGFAQKVVPDTIVTFVENTPYTNIGFGTQKKQYITSAVSSRTGAELRPAYTNNLTNTLYGRIPGLIVNQGGNEAGANTPGVLIRGANTFGFSQAPLIIIDGFLGTYTQLVPEEIEEITVLKDAAATAIYGMRAANGVLLVTTKKGVNKPLTVSFGAQYGFQQPTSLPKGLDAYNYALLFNEALSNDDRAPLYTQNDLDLYKNGTDPFFRPNVNWYNEALRKAAPFSNYNLNFSGGNNTVKYFAMLNGLTSDGLYKKFGDQNEESSNSTFNQYNFRVNVDVTVSKNLSAQLNIGGTVEEKKNPGDLTTGATYNLFDIIAPNAFPVYNPNGSFGGNQTYPGNPIGNLLSTGFSTSTGTNLQSSLRLTQLLGFITPGLKASVAVSFNNFYEAASNKRKGYQRQSIVRGTAGDTIISSFGQRTSLFPQETILGRNRNNAIQANLDYHRVFGKHDISGLVLFNSDNNDINRNYPNTDVANQNFPYKTNSVGTRLTYVNNQKYIAQFTASYMGTENFKPGNRYGFFPAVSLGWIASNEAFLKNSSFIKFLKIRGSYGVVGNEVIGGQRFAFFQRYGTTATYFLGTGNTNAFGLAEGRRANEAITWEKDRKTNIGLDLQLKNRIGFVLDVFNNKRSDILASSTSVLPQLLGFNGYPDQNIGKATNKGFEFSVNYSADKSRSFQFFTEAFVAYTKSTIDFNAEASQPNRNLFRTGFPIGQPFGLQALGLFQTQAEINASAVPLGIVVRPGDVKYSDIGGPNGVPDGIIDGNDSKAIGKTNIPEWTMGITTGFKYKGFDLNLIFQGVSGVNEYIGGSRFQAFQNNGSVSQIALDRWTPQNTDASYPRLAADNNLNNFRFSSFWMRDGSFLKLRVAELGYTFSGKLLSNLKLKETRLYLNGTNLFTMDKIEEGDAEALGGYPQLRTVSLGLRLNF